MSNDFAAIILSHGRPEKVVTYNTLRECGYTGRIVILIDNTDKKADRYKELYGDQVYVFDKFKVKSESESGNNFNDLRSTIFPRNTMFDVAKELGVKAFIQLDDDYISFRYKFDDQYKWINDRLCKPKNLDKLFKVFVEFMEKTPLLSLCFAQGGDFIG